MENLGQIFTPLCIAKKMLHMVEFTDDYLVNHLVLEPSFGEGVFLKEIVRRTLSYCYREQISKSEQKRILSNLYGIEIDKRHYAKTIYELNMLIKTFGLEGMDWNLICANSLEATFDFSFDLVIGNPPYVRLREMGEESLKRLEQFHFANGLTDMYIIFFELGLNWLKSDGRLCYITPNSYFKVKAQEKFRYNLAFLNLVEKLVDYGSYKVFDNASVCVAITSLNLGRKAGDNTHYTKMNTLDGIDFEVEHNLRNFMGNNWDFACKEDLEFLSKIKERECSLVEFCKLHSALETNANSVFLVDRNDYPEKEWGIVRKTVKASTLDDSCFLIFPYFWDESVEKYVLIEEDDLKGDYPTAYAHLMENKERLLKRDLHNLPWYGYARSQGMSNINKKKLVIKRLFSDKSDKLQVLWVDKDTLVYSGVYITVNEEDYYAKVKGILGSEDFARYVKLTGKTKQGGYKELVYSSFKNFRMERTDEYEEQQY